ncbi:hypothetical protein [Kitasatospora purpeofusca]|uniref:hypothetical protein n=1 Tax=Kitasatospora purpeofusca TaxID=67352 RepID=UPI0036D30E25
MATRTTRNRAVVRLSAVCALTGAALLTAVTGGQAWAEGGATAAPTPVATPTVTPTLTATPSTGATPTATPSTGTTPTATPSTGTTPTVTPSAGTTPTVTPSPVAKLPVTVTVIQGAGNTYTLQGPDVIWGISYSMQEGPEGATVILVPGKEPNTWTKTPASKAAGNGAAGKAGSGAGQPQVRSVPKGAAQAGDGSAAGDASGLQLIGGSVVAAVGAGALGFAVLRRRSGARG